MIDPLEVQLALQSAGMSRFAEQLPRIYSGRLAQGHGRLNEWQQVLNELPQVPPVMPPSLNTGTVGIGDGASIEPDLRERIEQGLRALHPWRKGPFSVHGIHVDTEWRSDMKWTRVSPHIEPLDGRTVLDVGAGNNYYGWRMIGEGARLVVGVDPTWLFLAQFLALRSYLGMHYPLYLLPLGIESLPRGLSCFDTVFSMGVLYHRRSPLDHLLELHEALRPGGQLVLETLVLAGREDRVLLPRKRYAKMRNVWFIPSVGAMETWLSRCGFVGIRTVDVTPTTCNEQRSTDWMTFESLPDFLDPANAALTLEGYPAPVRAVLVAHRP